MTQQIKDPVCGMSVDAKKSQYKANHEGEQYAFCCKECMSSFKENPSQYAAKKGQGHQKDARQHEAAGARQHQGHQKDPGHSGRQGPRR